MASSKHQAHLLVLLLVLIICVHLGESVWEIFFQKSEQEKELSSSAQVKGALDILASEKPSYEETKNSLETLISVLETSQAAHNGKLPTAYKKLLTKYQAFMRTCGVDSMNKLDAVGDFYGEINKAKQFARENKNLAPFFDKCELMLENRVARVRDRLYYEREQQDQDRLRRLVEDEHLVRGEGIVDIGI